PNPDNHRPPPGSAAGHRAAPPSTLKAGEASRAASSGSRHDGRATGQLLSRTGPKRSLPSSPALSELSPSCASYLALTPLQGPLMEWYTSIINLTVAAVLLVILV